MSSFQTARILKYWIYLSDWQLGMWIESHWGCVWTWRTNPTILLRTIWNKSITLSGSEKKIKITSSFKAFQLKSIVHWLPVLSSLKVWLNFTLYVVVGSCDVNFLSNHMTRADLINYLKWKTCVCLPVYMTSTLKSTENATSLGSIAT